jgi:hypothetical protein
VSFMSPWQVPAFLAWMGNKRREFLPLGAVNVAHWYLISAKIGESISNTPLRSPTRAAIVLVLEINVTWRGVNGVAE